MSLEFGEIEGKIKRIQQSLRRSRGNPSTAHGILENSTREEINSIMGYLESTAPADYVAIKENIILFEDLYQIDQKTVVQIINKFDSRMVGLALRSTTCELIDVFLKYAPRDDKDNINDILNGPEQKESDIDMARKKILLFIRPQVKSGTINIIGGKVPDETDNILV